MLINYFYKNGLSKSAINLVLFCENLSAVGLWCLTIYTMFNDFDYPKSATDNLVRAMVIRNGLDIVFVDNATVIHHMMVLLYSYMYMYCGHDVVKPFAKPVFYTELSSIFLVTKNVLRYVKPNVSKTYLTIYGNIETANMLLFGASFFYLRIYYYAKNALFGCYTLGLSEPDNTICNITDITFYGLNFFWGIYILKKGFRIFYSKK